MQGEPGAPEPGAFAEHGSFGRFMDHVPAAFAVTAGERHMLVYANAAFCALVGQTGRVLGRPVADLLAPLKAARVTSLLDRASRTSRVFRDRHLEPMDGSAGYLSYSVWPSLNASGNADHLVIEARRSSPGELTLAIQREVAERLLLSALREIDAASLAEESRHAAAFLAAEGRRVSASLDEATTLQAIERMTLRRSGDWCIVDMLDDSGRMHRLAVVHPDPARQRALDTLDGLWIPHPDDEFGLPAALRWAKPSLIEEKARAVLTNPIHDSVIATTIAGLDVGAVHTVPMLIGERLIGAITFVRASDQGSFSAQDVELALELAGRGAMALDRARLYAQALAHQLRAESASQAKSDFLGMMSHELRTPLNAIGGYVDLIDLEIHGTLSAVQHTHLARIRVNQRHLTSLVTDLLNLSKIDSGRLQYQIGDMSALEVITASLALVEPLFLQKGLTVHALACETSILASADRDKVIQILVNLFANAMKFTPSGGHLAIECDATEQSVRISVSDNGMGIPADKLDAIFEPFVQINATSTSPEAGIGLGLAISRSLARAMHGDLIVQSTLGTGSRFTLSLPRSPIVAQPTAGPG